ASRFEDQSQPGQARRRPDQLGPGQARPWREQRQHHHRGAAEAPQQARPARLPGRWRQWRRRGFPPQQGDATRQPL
ncbi:MAG: hypothetical protein AVDCRST_MAG51-1013, partial [uncultured Ramlibacter sp.]